MRRFAIVILLVLSGCLVDGNSPGPGPEPKPENAAVLAAVLDAFATGLENDGNLDSPRFQNTSHVSSALTMALEYRVGDKDIFEPGWLSDYERDYAAELEPDGEALPLTSERRRKAVEFIRKRAGELDGD